MSDLDLQADVALRADAALQAELDAPYPLDAAVIERFREDGFIRLPNVVSARALAAVTPELARLVDERNRFKDVPIAERPLYNQAFIQVSNLWTASEAVRQFAFGRRLARLAAELLGTRGVRMWHDQALFKEPSGGFTPWHVDQQYWPMASPLSVTAWIPLEAVPLEMGPLCFGRGSHRKHIGRELAISAESEALISAAIERERIVEVQEPFAAGDASFHMGWTLHRAGPNITGRPRRVFTVIYMDVDMRLAEPANKNQQLDWEVWTPSTRVGDVMDDPLNPVLWCADGD